MKSPLSAVVLLTVAANAIAQQEPAYFSHKGKTFDVDGFDASSYSYTGFNKYGKDKYGRSYIEVENGSGAAVDAGGRKMATTEKPASTGNVEPTESGDWENYWPSFGNGKDRVHKQEGIIRAGNGKIIDKAWYHISNRPAPTVTETQTQYEFTEVYITSSVAPTEDFWCDGGWIQITKEGDLMDDDWAVAYITGYLQVIGANVDDVDTYDWCVNTKDVDNAGACARQQAASHSPADIAAAFTAATDDHTSQIILFVCDLPCLDSICQLTQENYSKLTPLRLTEIAFTKTSGSARDVNTTCLDGESVYAPSNGIGSKTIRFCPQGQVCNTDNDAGPVQPGNPFCECQACPDIPFCLSPTCVVEQTASVTDALPVWISTPSCLPVNSQAACQSGYYYHAVSEKCTICNSSPNCRSTVCTGPSNAMCPFGSCQGSFVNTAAPGKAGTCFCNDPNGCGNLCSTDYVCELEFGLEYNPLQADTRPSVMGRGAFGTAYRGIELVTKLTYVQVSVQVDINVNASHEITLAAHHLFRLIVKALQSETDFESNRTSVEHEVELLDRITGLLVSKILDE
ncbi:hypothetical protein SARC_01273 [Sphaeroforma arctica JP610]|uniref:Protein kinase domain-containing protein n=1 Tax=Sphaeroforma arctica JP610 TaxID=667725 RepID=A0A0L0GC74_9EUKA|nr:hypothetical protein SARC_01273 [Sphaeroforma arctica JP610]KNC86592.1 hypothetical protein SARC_01273 [Sphaeroforma arctica JP610]|eukprot:XP_014160494.1 hypothetical protein SARC_01273 [Sphaeroforma arctica JP610]